MTHGSKGSDSKKAISSPEDILKQVFGYDEFRPFQKEIIDSLLQKKDVLAVMPTGGGKSLCYQVPALIFEGVTIVVSPLISLMHDQICGLETIGVEAVALNSSLDWEKYADNIRRIKNGEVKILYVAPETLVSDRCKELLSSIKVDCLTIDEAHCISQWGHDFRPSYLTIRESIDRINASLSVCAFTATATNAVKKDIIDKLNLKFTDKTNLTLAIN